MVFHFFNNLSSKKRAALIVLVALTAYAPAFIYWPRLLAMDWDYFNSISLVIRSAVLSYGTLPLHNPWVRGGIDMVANPQARVLSPLFILDILFSPNLANLLSFVIYSIAGLFGMLRLLALLQVSRASSIVTAIFFINCSYFGLHYAEGHVTYGSLQLLPWVFYFFLRARSSRGLFGLLTVLALMFLDGGMYSFGFSIAMCVSYFLITPALWAVPLRRFSHRKTRTWFVFAVAIFVLLILAKYLPIRFFYNDRVANFGLYRLPVTDVLRLLFCPLQKTSIGIASTHTRMHEIGCYIGLFSFALIGFAWFKSKEMRAKNKIWLLLSIAWAWLAFYWPGSEWFWGIYSASPLFEHLHVTPRVIIIGFLFYSILLARALDSFSNKKWWAMVAVALIAESTFTRIYPYATAYDFVGRSALPERTIANTRIVETINEAWRPEHYWTQQSTVHTYDPATPQTSARPSNHADYKGESYWISGIGDFTVSSYTPGRIEIQYSNETPVTMELNTNYLAGWSARSVSTTVSRAPSGLLQTTLPAGSGVAVLEYTPTYFPWTVACWLGGFCLWLLFAYLRGVPSPRSRKPSLN